QVEQAYAAALAEDAAVEAARGGGREKDVGRGASAEGEDAAGGERVDAAPGRAVEDRQLEAHGRPPRGRGVRGNGHGPARGPWAGPGGRPWPGRSRGA